MWYYKQATHLFECICVHNCLSHHHTHHRRHCHQLCFLFSMYFDWYQNIWPNYYQTEDILTHAITKTQWKIIIVSFLFFYGLPRYH